MTSKTADNELDIRKRFGDGTNPSVRQIAREFGTNEANLRRMMDRAAARGCPFARDFRQHRVDVLIARMEQELYELRELRKELARDA